MHNALITLTKPALVQDFFDKLSPFNKLLVKATIALLLYGYGCRMLGLYFFWETKTIGWVLLLFTIIGILLQRIKLKRAAGKKNVGENIGIGITVFILLFQGILFFVIPQTNAYKSAKHFLLTNSAIAAELGEVYDVFLVPVGGMAMSSSSAGQSGNADLNFIVKGSHKYKDVNLHLAKATATDWTIIETK